MPHIVGHFYYWDEQRNKEEASRLRWIEQTNETLISVSCLSIHPFQMIIDPEKPEGFLGNQTPFAFPGTLARLKNENIELCIYRLLQQFNVRHGKHTPSIFVLDRTVISNRIN